MAEQENKPAMERNDDTNSQPSISSNEQGTTPRTRSSNLTGSSLIDDNLARSPYQAQIFKKALCDWCESIIVAMKAHRPTQSNPHHQQNIERIISAKNCGYYICYGRRS